MNEAEVRNLIETEARRLFPILVEQEFGASVSQIRRFFTSGRTTTPTITLGVPDRSYTLPQRDGTSGQQLTTNGNGAITFQ